MVRPATPGTRLDRAARSEALLDAAALLLAEHGPAALTMDAVAAEAGVSRPLVYKHFANRDELLAALHGREAEKLDAIVVEALTGAADIESAVRASVEALLDALAGRPGVVIGLLRAEATTPDLAEQRQSRLRTSQRLYQELLAGQLGLERDAAATAAALFFSGLETGLQIWRSNPTPAARGRVEDLVVRFVVGGLEALRP